MDHLRIVLLAVLVSVLAGCKPPRDTSVAAADPMLDDHELIGVTPSEWTTEDWQNSDPLSLSSLRGRVVLVRWFMATECPLCTATAPALNTLHDDLAPKGLTVVGLYHHRGNKPRESGEYEQYVRRYGFKFPVAVDVNWSTLERWWLRGHRREFTSVSFLLDKQGRVRGIHPGGRYGLNDPSYAAMRRAIEALLAEPG
jgi:peroxiredoxin